MASEDVTKFILGGIYNKPFAEGTDYVAEGHVVARNEDAEFYEVIDPSTFAEDTGDSVDLYYNEEKGEYEILPPETDLSQVAEEFSADASVPGTVRGSLKFNESYQGDRRAALTIVERGDAGLNLATDTKKETALVATFNIEMQALRAGIVTPVSVKDTDITVAVELTEEQYLALKQYDKVEVIYFDENGEEKERFEATIEERAGDTGSVYAVVFDTTHLSTYGVAGVNVAEEDGKGSAGATTPDTGAFTAKNDGNVTNGVMAVVAVMVGLAVAVAVWFAGYRIYRRHDARRFK